jgi:hypothetical protein
MSGRELAGGIRRQKLLEAIAGEQRLYFNDELRRHTKLSIIFNPKGPGHEM